MKSYKNHYFLLNIKAFIFDFIKHYDFLVINILLLSKGQTFIKK
jgi:hypothetical protein